MENAIHWISQLDPLIRIRWIVIYPLDSRRHLASEHPGLVVDHRQYSCLPYNLRITDNTNLPKQDVINNGKTNLSLHQMPGVGGGGEGGWVGGEGDALSID